MLKFNRPRPRVPCAVRQGCDSNLTRNVLSKEANKSYFHVCTINARTLHRDCDIDQMIEQLDNINADVVAIQETRSPVEKVMDWHTGHRVVIGAGADGTGGVGFIITPRRTTPGLESFEVLECKVLSARIASLKLRIGREVWVIVNVYFPTSASTDDDVELMYEMIERELAEKCDVKIVLGDFNASIGECKVGEEYIGQFAADERNDRGQRLADFAESSKLYVGNTLFEQKKRRLWTWMAPKGFKKQLDYVLVNRRALLVQCKAIGMTYCDTRSDHRLVRATFKVKETRKRPRISRRDRVDVDKATVELKKYDWDEIGDNPRGYKTLAGWLKEVTLEARPIITRTPRERLSQPTIDLLKRRREMISRGDNVQHLARQLRAMIVEDYRAFAEKKAVEAAEKMMSIKRTRQTYSLKRDATVSMKDVNGVVHHGVKEVAQIIDDFYSSLFASKVDVPISKLENAEEVPDILPCEVEASIRRMPKGKAVGQDKVAADVLKMAGPEVIQAITRQFNAILKTGRVPEDWKSTNTILLFKKGDKSDIGNYRPIALMSQLCKMFSRVILNRIARLLKEGSRREQAGFKAGFSTVDHIYTVTQLLEITREFHIPLCLLFIDFKKAFDSVEKKAVLNALKMHGVSKGYVDMIDQLYTDCSTRISLLKTPVKVPVKRGVKQGDVLSPSLFSACLEIVLRDLDLEGGVNIDGEKLQYLLFADDIVLVAHNPEDLQRMLEALNELTSKIGLEMHPGKTQWMCNKYCDRTAEVMFNNRVLERVDEYIYLGRLVNPENNLLPELARRRQSGWKAFWKLKDVLTNRRLSIETRAAIFNTHVLPAMVYASETWNTTQSEEESLRVTQRAMERRMLGVRRRELHNDELRERSKVADVVERLYVSKRRWAGHVVRRSDNRWSTRVLEWYPYDRTRPRGRPPTRWADPILKTCGGRKWTRLARDRIDWRSYDLHGWRAFH